MLLTFDLLHPKCKGTFLQPSCIYMQDNKVICRNIVSELKCCQVHFVAMPFDLKIYKYFSFCSLHICIKYESCILITAGAIVVESGCFQSQVLILTFDPLPLKYIGIFLSTPCIYAWNKDNSSCRIRTKLLTKFYLWSLLLNFRHQNI